MMELDDVLEGSYVLARNGHGLLWMLERSARAVKPLRSHPLFVFFGS